MMSESKVEGDESILDISFGIQLKDQDIFGHVGGKGKKKSVQQSYIINGQPLSEFPFSTGVVFEFLIGQVQMMVKEYFSVQNMVKKLTLDLA